MNSIYPIIIFLHLIPLALLLWRNFPKADRYAQLWSPLTATAVSAVFFVGFINIEDGLPALLQ